MKKFICALSVFLSLALFSGCGIILPENIDTDKAYILTASVQYGSSGEVKISLNRTASGAWSGTVNEPYALQGITLSYSSGILTLNREKMSAQSPEAGALLLIDALESGFSLNSETNVRIIGSGIEISGSNKNGAFVLMLDRETTLPISVTVAEHQLSASFSEVTAKAFEAPIINDFADISDFNDFAA